jgi:hypothetical protein
MLWYEALNKNRLIVLKLLAETISSTTPVYPSAAIDNVDTSNESEVELTREDSSSPVMPDFWPADYESVINNEVKSVSNTAKPKSSNGLAEGIETDLWESFKQLTPYTPKKKKHKKKGGKKGSKKRGKKSSGEDTLTI